MKRIFLILALLAAVILGASWYVHRSRTRALNSGDVFIREQSAPPSTPASPSAPASANGAEAPSAGQPPAAAESVPASDTIARNPPNGMRFIGSGKYQLYRQGDITWRLNTDTGWACVLLATDVQWRRARVYQDGCRAFNESAPVTGY